MIDTQVLSFALVVEAPRNAAHLQMQEDAAALIRSLDAVRVSSIVVMEMLRAPKLAAKLRTSGILDELDVVPFDYPMAVEAARILAAARGKVDTCTACLNVRGSSTCKGCGQLVSHQQKTNDALVVATAAMVADIDTLYTFDGGVRELGAFVKGLTVCPPPNIHGPLWALLAAKARAPK